MASSTASHFLCYILLTPWWPTEHTFLISNESFQVYWDNRIPIFSMLPSTFKYLCSVEPVRMHFRAKQPCINDTVCNAACNIAHSIIFTRLFGGKMHSDWFNRIEILQVRWQHGEKVGYYYSSGLEKTLCKWDIYVPLFTKGLTFTFQRGPHVKKNYNFLCFNINWSSINTWVKL
jgi:hypothetical protein